MDVAIIGVSCKFPESDDQFEFWQKLLDNQSSITEIPSNRWDWKAYWGDPKKDINKTNCCWGGFVRDVDAFDAGFFGLVPKVVTSMDPQQRLLLEQVWKCLEDGGLAPNDLRGTRVGTFASMFNHDYKQIQESGQLTIEAHHATGSAASIIVNRVSHYFDFKGPSLAIDAACSGGLNAIHNAAQALELDDCDLAIACGVNLILTPTRHISFSKMGMMSPTGTCRTFDDSANGYVRGEGVGVVLMKPLEQAIADNDQIYGVLKGSAVNHCGETYTLTYPSPEAQANVIKDAHRRAGVAVNTVNYIEAHGTGTPKGDPIEFRGLTRAYEELAKEQSLDLEEGFCSLGSVKTNIGHLEAAAGFAGVIKVLMSLKSGQLPALHHYKKLNHKISLTDSPFSMLDREREWPVLRDDNDQVIPRRAGVSSFGFGGTNAHVVLEEAPRHDSEALLNARDLPVYPICVSGKSEEALNNNLDALQHWVDQQPSSLSLKNLSYTLTHGRDHFEHRKAALVSNLDELKTFLSERQSFAVEDHDELMGVEQATALFSKKRASQKNLTAALSRIVSLYLQGKTIRWKGTFEHCQAFKISAPGNVFIKDRFWLDSTTELHDGHAAKLAELVHENISDFESQAFVSSFTGEEFFLKQHNVRGKSVFPAAAYLEMVRSGLAMSIKRMSDDKKQIRLTEVNWLRPLVIEEKAQVILSFYPLESVSGHPELAFEINDDDAQLYCRGVAEVWPDSFAETVLEALHGGETFTGEGLYSLLTSTGLDYGPMHQGIGRLQIDQQAALAEITLSQSPNADDFMLHPGLLDAAIQVCVLQSLHRHLGASALSGDSSVEGVLSPLPYRLQSMRVFGALSGQLKAYSKLVSDEASQPVFDLSIFNVNDDGHASLALELTGLTLVGGQFLEGSSSHVLIEKALPESVVNTLSSMDPRHLQTLYTPQWIVSEGELQNIHFSEKHALFISQRDDESKALYQTLSTQFASLTYIEIGQDAESNLVINADDSESVVAIADFLKQSAIKPDYLIHFVSGLDADTQTAHALFSLTKALMKISRAMQMFSFVQSPEPLSYPEMLGLSGFYKTVNIEKPSFRGCVVQDLAITAERVWSELRNSDINTDVCYLDNKRWIRCFNDLNSVLHTDNADHRLSSTHTDHAPVAQFTEKGVYLITGGLGALGLIFARHLLKNYSARVVLTGRSVLDETKQKQLDELSRLGGSAHYLSCDVGDGEDTQRVVAKVREEFGALNGVLHSAGVIEDSFILRKSPEAFSRVVTPKLDGTLNLHRAIGKEPLDLFVMFSSVTGVLGNIGQCDYSYGNSFEDYFSYYRNHLCSDGQCSGKTLAINWPYWQDGGMTLTDQEQAILEQSFGLVALQTEDGVSALESALALPFNQVCVMPGNASKVRQVLGCVDEYTSSGSTSSGSTPLGNASSGNTSSGNTSLKNAASDSVVPINANVSESEVIEYLANLFADTLKMPASRFMGGGSFQSFGFDSVIMLDMTALMEKKFKDLPKTLFYEHQTMAELADFLMENYSHCFADPQVDAESDDSAKVDSNAEQTTEPEQSRRRKQKFSDQGAPSAQDTAVPIAVIGIAGRYPDADTLKQFWRNLSDGKDCISEIPADRWAFEQSFQTSPPVQGKSYSKWGGFLNNVDYFDPLHFNISPFEAERLDPNERQFLEVVAHAIEDSGYHTDNLVTGRGNHDRPVGVYAGCMWGDYQLHGVESSNPQDWVSPQSFYWSVANRVSYHLNFSGPSITLDTACSSSITAIHMACNALAAGEIDVAVAGAVNLTLHQNKYNLLSNLHFLSTDGRCRSFGQGGDGYVPAEGVGAVILKPLAQAEKDGDHIHAVIRGTAVNHGGETSGFTVPNPKRQAALIKEAMRRGQVEARQMSYLEAHGTGTSVGDPIEISGLTKAYQSNDIGFCRIGSVKSNIGHAEASSGIAGLTKVIQQMQHQQLVPSLHSTDLNPFLSMDSTPFKVQQTLEHWPRPIIDGKEAPRISGINSFGAGGSNSHMIVEEYLPAPRPETLKDQLVVLSARSEVALQEMAENLCEHLIEKPDLSLADVAYTLQTGRSLYDWRLAIVAGSIATVMESLKAYLAGGNESDLFYFASVKKGQTQEAIAQSGLELSQLAQAWVVGQRVNWSHLHAADPHRVSLPGYPYQRSRYWIQKVASTESNNISSLHPVLDSNCSEHGRVLFSKAFKGNEFYLTDHQIHQNNVLPGVVCLEMAQQAAKRALPEQSLHALYDIEWLKPIVVGDDSETVMVSAQADDYGLAFELYQQSGVPVCRGAFGYLPESSADQEIFKQRLDVDSLAAKQIKFDDFASFATLSETAIQDGFAQLGFGLGESLRAFKGVQYNASSALAHLKIPGAVVDTAGSFDLHPSLMDCALRTCLTVDGFNTDMVGIPVPISLKRLQWLGALTEQVWVHARQLSVDSALSQECYEVFVVDDQGKVLLYLEQFVTQRVVGLFPNQRSSAKASVTVSVPAPVQHAAAVEVHAINSEPVEAFVIESIAKQTKIAPSDIHAADAIESFGVNSIMALSIHADIAEVFGEEVPKTLFFEYETVADLAQFLIELQPQVAAQLSSGVAVDTQQSEVAEPEVQASEDSSTDQLIEYLLQRLADMNVKAVSANQTLAELAFDAVQLMQLSARLFNDFGVDAQWLLRSENSLADLAQALIAQGVALSESSVSGSSEMTAPVSVHPHRRLAISALSSVAVTSAAENDDIAIIGLAGRYPQADNMDEFWQNLLAGKDSISQIPEERWRHESYFHPDRHHKGTAYSKWGGFMNNIDHFDADFFGMTRRESELLDPQERLFLETVWQCFEDAAYPRSALSEREIGVFVGAMWGQYELLQVSEQQKAFGLPASTFSAIANRVSYWFDLRGPSMAVDSMCSSSLTAIHTACQSIQSGDCEMAIAGGVNLSIHPTKYLQLSALQFLSTDGRCRAFGEGGDGYVPGEGVGAVLLKSAKQAELDGDNVYAVIKASALNHGGKASGFTVPNPRRQARVIKSALDHSGWDASSVNYLEAHGTGTSLGDPIELSGLTEAYGKAEQTNCALASVKSNIGHLESAAGIAGLTKILLQMRHETIAPSLHSASLNPNLNFSGSRFFVPQQPTHWQAAENGLELRAGLSSFGAGGSNAHLLVERRRLMGGLSDSTINALKDQPQLFVISAEGEARLRLYVERLQNWLPEQMQVSEKAQTVTFLNLCYSAMIGREQGVARLAIVARSLSDLVSKLALWQASQSDANVYFNAESVHAQALDAILDAQAEDALLQSLLSRRDLSALAKIWVSYMTIDWSDMYLPILNLPEGSRLQRISFPTQPLMGERYWVDEVEPQSTVINSLHPLLDENVSTMSVQRFEKHLTGHEFFLRDHQVDIDGPQLILPGVAHLEMARAAAERSIPDEYSVLNLHDVLWLRPVDHQDKGEHEKISIDLTPVGQRVAFSIQNDMHECSSGQIDFCLKSDAPVEEWLQIDSLMSDDAIREEKEEIYELFEGMGFFYGPSYRCTEWRLRETNKALARLSLPDNLKANSDRFFLHPSLMDAAVRTCLGLGDSVYLSPMVPFSLEHIEMRFEVPNECYVFVTLSDQSTTSVNKYNLVITDIEGRIAVKIRHLSARYLNPKTSTLQVAQGSSVQTYKHQWQPYVPVSSSASNRVLILAERSELVNELELHLTNAPIAVVQGNILCRTETFDYDINTQSADGFSRLFEDLQNRNMMPDVIVNLMGVAFTSSSNSGANNSVDIGLEQALAHSLHLNFNLFKGLAPFSTSGKIRVFNVYDNSNILMSQCLRSLTGFANSMTNINHRIEIATVGVKQWQQDVPNLIELTHSDGKFNGLAIRVNGQHKLEHQVLVPTSVPEKQGALLAAVSTCVITGGLGKLGLLMAEHLIDNCAPNIVLVSRRAPDSAQQAIIAKLNTRNSDRHILCLQADIADADSTQKVMAQVRTEFGRIDAVIHAAGAAGEQGILDIDQNEFDASHVAKIQGLLNLHHACEKDTLQWFVNFSSVSSLVGDLGCGSYAAGNQFMDLFSESHPNMLSIAWPLWADGGLTIPEEDLALLAFSGLTPMPEKIGLSLFDQVVLNKLQNLIIAYGDNARLEKVLDVVKAPLSDHAIPVGKNLDEEFL